MADDNAHQPKDLPHSPGPAGGWGSMKGIASIYGETWASSGALDSLRRLNKPKGVMCMSCAWPKPANYSAFEFCENGAKATLWELTKDRCTPEFFAAEGHTLAELREWSDHELEKSGRLTHPMKYDPASDRYVPIDWDTAFAEIGTTLRDLPREDRGDGDHPEDYGGHKPAHRGQDLRLRAHRDLYGANPLLAALGQRCAEVVQRFG